MYNDNIQNLSKHNQHALASTMNEEPPIEAQDEDLDEDLDEYLKYEKTEDEPEKEAIAAPIYEIFSYPADTSLKGYLEQWDNHQLEIPPFQREYVWDQTRASKLIESFMLGLPVPPVFLYKAAGSKSFWIIDGQQRIHSIVFFQKGTFGEVKFRLKGVDARWAGKTFDELTEEDQFTLQTTVLRSIVIQQTNPNDHSSIFHIFERLNTGGIRLSPMEVRQCVYASDFLEDLKNQNRLSMWREIIGIEKHDKRLKDVELLLRILALYRSLETYEKPMKGFLNDCAAYFQIQGIEDPDTTTKVRHDIIEKFSRACSVIHTELGAKPFHLRGRLNYSALDAVFVAVMRNGASGNLKSQFGELTKNDDFIKAISFNTSDESVLQGRLKLALETLV